MMLVDVESAFEEKMGTLTIRQDGASSQKYVEYCSRRSKSKTIVHDGCCDNWRALDVCEELGNFLLRLPHNLLP